MHSRGFFQDVTAQGDLRGQLDESDVIIKSARCVPILMYHCFAGGHFGRVEHVVTLFPSERAHANHNRIGAGI